MSHQMSDTSRLIAAMQPPGDDASSIGGVRLEPQHLLDNQEPMEGSMMKPEIDTQELEADEADLIDFPDTVPPTRRNSMDSDFPTLGEAATVKDKKKPKLVTEGMNTLTLNDPSLSDWSKMLFAGVQANAAAGQGTGTTMVDYRRAILPGEGGKEHLIATDWDHKVFKRAKIDGHYKCPFTRCRCAYRSDHDDFTADC